VLILRNGKKIDEIMDIAKRVLVGRVWGRRYMAARLKKWVQENWSKDLKSMHEVCVLSQGWFAFTFYNSKQLCWVIANHWNIEHSPIHFKRWMLIFNMEREQLGVGTIWLRLPGFPMHLWTEYIFQRKGDDLGKFLDYDKSFIEIGNMSCARVLVFLDTREGLVENLILQYKGYTHNQKLDYEGVPFRCHHCHKIGHIYRECPLVQKHQENWASSGSTVLKGMGNNMEKGREERTQMNSSQRQQSPPKRLWKKIFLSTRMVLLLKYSTSLQGHRLW